MHLDQTTETKLFVDEMFHVFQEVMYSVCVYVQYVSCYLLLSCCMLYVVYIVLYYCSILYCMLFYTASLGQVSLGRSFKSQ